MMWTGWLCVLAALSTAALADLMPEETAYEMIVEYKDYYELPKLPYAYNALEPFISEATLQVHHKGHHKAYCKKMNEALKAWREKEPDSELAKASLYDVMRNLSKVPVEWRTAIRNNGGGFINHIFYWITMRNKVYTAPFGALEEQVNATFGDYKSFQEQFTQAATTLFGSGYVWLVEDADRKLSIVTTANQDSPISDGLYPLLVLDVWEHAYYLQYQYKRTDYISKWWSIAHWGAAGLIQEWWREVRGDVDKEEGWYDGVEEEEEEEEEVHLDRDEL